MIDCVYIPKWNQSGILTLKVPPMLLVPIRILLFNILTCRFQCNQSVAVPDILFIMKQLDQLILRLSGCSQVYCSSPLVVCSNIRLQYLQAVWLLHTTHAVMRAGVCHVLFKDDIHPLCHLLSVSCATSIKGCINNDNNTSIKTLHSNWLNLV